MDITQLAITMVKNNPKWVKKIESISGQPVDYTFKCVNEFLDQLHKGPGIKTATDKLATFRSNYELVMGLGCFKDYEAQILAADISGFNLAEVVQHFRMNLKWDTNIDEISSIYEQLVPKFKEVAKKAGLIKDDDLMEVENSGIPNFGGKPGSRDGSMTPPPWKTQSSSNMTFNRNISS